MVNLGKIKIHASFFFFMILIIALGYLKQFFLLVCITTLHELAHVLAAKAMKLPLESIIITPIGETAYIKGFDSLLAPRKYIILFAGPFANIAMAAILFSIFGDTSENVGLCVRISLAIGFFNLLPIYPLDGGKLLFVFSGNRCGILKSVRYVKNVTKAGIVMLLIIGLLQLILFPLNMSLIAIGAFLLSIFEREKNSMVFSYYNCMTGKAVRLRTGVPARTAVFAPESLVAEVERTFTWDYFHMVYIAEGGAIIAALTEKQVFEAAFEHGINNKTKLLDIIGGDDI